MNISIFNRKYWVRRFGEQKEVKGYLTTQNIDFVASIHVHPLGNDKVMALPEGERNVLRLEGHNSSPPLRAANQELNQKGDLLRYDGAWYECVSAQKYDHTLLSHYNYQFVIVPNDASKSIDVENPPTEDPETWTGESDEVI